jgi:hypothetical protein
LREMETKLPFSVHAPLSQVSYDWRTYLERAGGEPGRWLRPHYGVVDADVVRVVRRGVEHQLGLVQDTLAKPGVLACLVDPADTSQSQCRQQNHLVYS